MENISLIVFVIAVILPLFANSLYDAITGYLYRPLTHFAAFIAVIGTAVLWYSSILTSYQIFAAIAAAALILLLLWCTQSGFIRFRHNAGKNEFLLGRGDYRIIMITSYLCALQSPTLALFALVLSGCGMLLLFMILAVFEYIEHIVKTDAKPFPLPARIEKFYLNQSQSNAKSDQINISARLYSAHSAPMGLAIVISAFLTLFGSIAQT
ncbi:hypothetical protein RQN30_01230 [Arcanobacterium hippocoleae]